jgi:hypothetical protein
MTADRAKVLDKLKKLKAHAQSAHEIKSQEEAAAFANMVQTMIVKHNIEQSELDAFALEEELQMNPMKEISPPSEFMHKHRQRRAWLENLAAYVAHAHFCEVLYAPNRFYVFFCGREAQVQMAVDVYIQLVRTAEKLAQAEYFKHYHEVRGNDAYASIKGFKPAYLDAFVNRLGTRYRQKMLEMQNDINAAAGAMVLFKSEAQLLKEFLASILNPKKKSVKKINNLFLEFGSEIRPTIQRKWGQGKQWAIVMGEKTIIDLLMTEIEAFTTLDEEHSLKEAKHGTYHSEGSKRGQAAADKLDLGSNPPSRMKKQIGE